MKFTCATTTVWESPIHYIVVTPCHSKSACRCRAITMLPLYFPREPLAQARNWRLIWPKTYSSLLWHWEKVIRSCGRTRMRGGKHNLICGGNGEIAPAVVAMHGTHDQIAQSRSYGTPWPTSTHRSKAARKRMLLASRSFPQGYLTFMLPLTNSCYDRYEWL